MTIKFITNSNSNDGGFVANYDAIVPIPEGDCMASNAFELTDYSGTFGCDGYANNVEVTWSISVNTDFIILLEFDLFTTQSAYDFVTIFDGPDTSATNLGSWSGRFKPPALSSSSNELYVIFTSDSSVTLSGFEASYTTYYVGNDDSACFSSTSHTLSDSHGTFGCSGYGNDVTVTWVIDAPAGDIISVEFVNFNTELNADIVTIYDGETTTSPVIGTYSGSVIPPSVRSSGNSMFVKFQTSPSTQLSGFEASYQSLVKNNTSVIPKCSSSGSKTLTTPEGEFGCNGYENHLDMSWTITVSSTKRINLSFLFLATEEIYDYIKIYDGTSTSSTLLATVSGTVAPNDIVSSSNNVLVTFHSDGSVNSLGFTIDYFSVEMSQACNHNAQYQLTAADGDIGCDGYANNVQVSWHIHTFGMILLHFNSIETEEAYDTISVYDGANSSAHLLATFSGTHARSVTSSGPDLYIVFQSDDSVTYSGFRSEYISMFTGFADEEP